MAEIIKPIGCFRNVTRLFNECVGVVQQKGPLTYEDINTMWTFCVASTKGQPSADQIRDFARAIERAHGIE